MTKTSFPFVEAENEQKMFTNFEVMKYYKIFELMQIIHPDIPISKIPIVPYNAYNIHPKTNKPRKCYSHPYWKLMKNHYKLPLTKLSSLKMDDLTLASLLCHALDKRVRVYPCNQRSYCLGAKNSENTTLSDFFDIVRKKSPLLFELLLEECKSLGYHEVNPRPNPNSSWITDEELDFLSTIAKMESKTLLPPPSHSHPPRQYPEPTPQDMECPWEYQTKKDPSLKRKSSPPPPSPPAAKSTRPRRQAFVEAEKRLQEYQRKEKTDRCQEWELQLEEDLIRYGPPEPAVVYVPYKIRIASNPHKRRILEQILEHSGTNSESDDEELEDLYFTFDNESWEV